MSQPKSCWTISIEMDPGLKTGKYTLGLKPNTGSTQTVRTAIINFCNCKVLLVNIDRISFPIFVLKKQIIDNCVLHNVEMHASTNCFIFSKKKWTKKIAIPGGCVRYLQCELLRYPMTCHWPRGFRRQSPDPPCQPKIGGNRKKGLHHLGGLGPIKKKGRSSFSMCTLLTSSHFVKWLAGCCCCWSSTCIKPDDYFLWFSSPNAQTKY